MGWRSNFFFFSRINISFFNSIILKMHRQISFSLSRTHSDKSSPFVQESVCIDLSDSGVVRWAESVWFPPALMQDKEDCKSISFMSLLLLYSALEFRLQHNAICNLVSAKEKEKKWSRPLMLDDTFIAVSLIKIRFHRTLWICPQITGCLQMWNCKTEEDEKVQSDDVRSIEMT